ncbi:MAG: 2-oxoacid:ferredoxin oxidoreductase subunit beta [Lewinellaceae bacterium]|nr:2-oxoacid:ferredoxin oxidoreductase subunit beta [Lewinellaceae bacterium]
MSYILPPFRHPDLPTNELGFARKDYEGALSTLCAGCGHDSISSAIIQACYEMNIEPHRLAKLSGIGCSSKTPAYFLGNSHGFNSVHGRMPSVATGANLANRQLLYLGVSGDGDSASIGIGQFVHAIRRNLNIVYIVMNNGCYGLTKGQDSATADAGSVSKKGHANPFTAINMTALAIEMGANFVARSFSGDKHQLIPLIKAAMNHPGFALIDVVSPCVTFNNNVGSTKSYDFVREHKEATSEFDFVPEHDEITADYAEGSSLDVAMHDGSIIHLSKVAKGWDPRNRFSALSALNNAEQRGEILTGLLFVHPEGRDLHSVFHTVEAPLNSLQEKDLCPGKGVLAQINDSFR